MTISKDGDEQGLAKKKNKVKLEQEETDGGDRMPHRNTTTIAIMGEWAKKRIKSSNSKSSNNNVKWTTTVFAWQDVWTSATSRKPRLSV